MTNTLVVAVMNRNEFRKTFKEEHPDVKGVTMVSVHQFLHVLETLKNFMHWFCIGVTGLPLTELYF